MNTHDKYELPPLPETDDLFGQGYTSRSLKDYACAAIEADRQSQPNAEDEWRRLALQFDAHRIQAMGWLKALVERRPEHVAAPVKEFLKAPPLSGEKVLAERLSAMAQPTALQSQDRDDAERYRWLKANGSMAVESFAGKYRVVDAGVSLVITDWLDSFDEAIDYARRVEGE